MNFVTIHELSRSLNIPDRVVRYRFNQLRQAGSLVEGDDFRRDDYVDDLHFTWKINPLAFMRETQKSAQQIPNPFPAFQTPPPIMESSGYQDGRQHPPFASKVVNQPDGTANNVGSHVVNQRVPVGSNFGNEAPPVVTKVPEEPKPASSPTLEREMLDFMTERIRKQDEQMQAKDLQISDLSKQNQELNKLNISLVGQAIRQGEQIQELMRIAATAPKDEPDLATKGFDVVANMDDVANNSVNQDDDFVDNLDNNVVNQNEDFATNIVDHTQPENRVVEEHRAA